jgi:hypothetical protein
MRRGWLPAFSCRHLVDGLERTSGRNACPRGIHPIDHHVADPEPPRIADRSKAGRPRAQDPPLRRAHAPPTTPWTSDPRTTETLDTGGGTSKEKQLDYGELAAVQRIVERAPEPSLTTSGEGTRPPK